MSDFRGYYNCRSTTKAELLKLFLEQELVIKNAIWEKLKSVTTINKHEGDVTRCIGKKMQRIFQNM